MGAPRNINPSATTSWTSSVGVHPLFLSMALLGALGSAYVKELVDASLEEDLEDHSSSEELADASSE